MTGSAAKPMSENELSAWQPAEIIGFWEWLPKYFTLSKEYSEVVGLYPTELVPVFKLIADWLDDDSVREICVRKPTQIGLTTLVIAWQIYRQHQRPGPAMFCMADQSTAEEMCKQRFVAAFEGAKCFDNSDIVVTKEKITIPGGGSIKMAWASSIAKLASSSIRDYAADEITKPGYSLDTAEGDSVGRLRYRAKSFDNGKGIIFSTVTEEGDLMHEMEKAADCIYSPHIPCPHCGAYQPLFFFKGNKYRSLSGDECSGGYVTWNKALEIGKYERAKSAGYQCGECDAVWTNSEKNEAMQKCVVGADRELVEQGENRFIWLWRIHEIRGSGSMEKIVLEFFDAKESGKPANMQSFYNNALALYWSQIIAKPDDSSVRASVIEYDRSRVPDEAVALICTVDQQKYGYWYNVRAWANNETSWKLEHGFVSTEAELDQILFERTWPSQHGQMGIWRIGIDTGGGMNDESGISSTEWVYQWYFKNMRRRGQIILCKGSSTRLPEEIKIGDPILTLPSGKKLPQSLRLVLIDTNKVKDLLFYRVKQATAETPICPAYVSHEEKDEYFKQLTSEHKVLEGRRVIWKQNGSQDNHLLDCEAMQMAISSRLLRGGVFLIREPVGIISPAVVKTNLPRQPKGPNPYTEGC